MARAMGSVRSERSIVVAYLAAALLAAMATLPSVLRPPQQEQQAGAAFSPDAPPDQDQPSVFSGFGQASSGSPAGVDDPATTTTLPGQPVDERGVPITTTTTQPPPQKAPNACPFGFGDPPRQIESRYAPPCATAFVGDNGGATNRGVTASTIDICFMMSLTGALTTAGPIGNEVAPGDSSQLRTYKVFQKYFNSRYQLYGRQLRFVYVTNPSGQTGEAQNRARAQRAANEFKCFATYQETDHEEADELARLKMFTWTLAQFVERWFSARDPYVWSFTPAGSQMTRMGAEYLCKKLAGKPPTYTTGPLRSQPVRKFGIIAYNPEGYDDLGGTTAKLLREQCGVDAAVVNYDLSGSAGGTAGLSNAVVQLNAQGVTTIMYLGDLISAAVFTSAATSSNYYPEWFLPGFGGVDTGTIARDTYDKDQWKHAFGYSFYEIPKPLSETECYKAYHEIDPDNEPNTGMCTYMWGGLVQMFGSIQRSGPNLTIESMRKALVEQPKIPPEPPHHMAGGYGPSDHTYPDWASEMWWDNDAPAYDGATGAYRFPKGGVRRTYGQWNAEDNGLFKEGLTVAR